MRTFVTCRSAGERLVKLLEGLVHPLLVLVEGRQHRGVQMVVEDRRVVGAELRVVPSLLLADALLDLRGLEYPGPAELYLHIEQLGPVWPERRRERIPPARANACMQRRHRLLYGMLLLLPKWLGDACHRRIVQHVPRPLLEGALLWAVQNLLDLLLHAMLRVDPQDGLNSLVEVEVSRAFLCRLDSIDRHP